MGVCTKKQGETRGGEEGEKPPCMCAPGSELRLIGRGGNKKKKNGQDGEKKGMDVRADYCTIERRPLFNTIERRENKRRVTITKKVGWEKGKIHTRVPGTVEQTYTKKKEGRSHTRQYVRIENMLLMGGWDFCQKCDKTCFFLWFCCA